MQFLRTEASVCVYFFNFKTLYGNNRHFERAKNDVVVAVDLSRSIIFCFPNVDSSHFAAPIVMRTPPGRIRASKSASAAQDHGIPHLQHFPHRLEKLPPVLCPRLWRHIRSTKLLYCKYCCVPCQGQSILLSMSLLSSTSSTSLLPMSLLTAST